MNNKPVAWMLADKEKEYIRSIMAVQHDFVPQGCVEIPLYTHPSEHDLGIAEAIGFEKGHKSAEDMLRAQADLINCLRMGQPNIDYDKELLKPTFVGRELTDEEIMSVAHEAFERYKNWHHYQIEFARAILRKAQEK